MGSSSSSSLEGSLYQVSAIDMLACLATIVVNIALRVPFCFSSTLVIQPKTIAVILAFSL